MTYGANIPEPVRGLLDYIGVKESGGRYWVTYGGHQTTLSKQIIQMTIAELTDAQVRLGRKYGSSAAGKYQHLRKTLLAQVKRLGIPMTALFSPGLQDDLGWDLLRQRGLDRFLAGEMSRSAFGNALAQEWASLPVLLTVTDAKGKKHVRGRSWYDGDGLNAAGRKAEDFEKALDKMLALHRAGKAAGAQQPPADATPQDNPAIAAQPPSLPPDMPDEHEEDAFPKGSEPITAIRLRWVVAIIIVAALAALLWRAFA